MTAAWVCPGRNGRRPPGGCKKNPSLRRGAGISRFSGCFGLPTPTPAFLAKMLSRPIGLGLGTVLRGIHQIGSRHDRLPNVSCQGFQNNRRIARRWLIQFNVQPRPQGKHLNDLDSDFGTDSLKNLQSWNTLERGAKGEMNGCVPLPRNERYADPASQQLAARRLLTANEFLKDGRRA